MSRWTGFNKAKGQVFQHDNAPSGTFGHISFSRLVELLQSHEAKPGETITGFHIDSERGDIRYRVEIT